MNLLTITHPSPLRGERVAQTCSLALRLFPLERTAALQIGSAPPDRSGDWPLAACESPVPAVSCIETPLFFALIADFPGQKGVCFEEAVSANSFFSNKVLGSFPLFSIFFRFEACWPPRGASEGFRRKEASQLSRKRSSSLFRFSWISCSKRIFCCNCRCRAFCWRMIAAH